ncbi:hypothetical protein [Antarcticirhabdus aurantiaca]|uniref:Uncharacterized protein n=1 Tax=Antarcticirhabdus aurantiaca TaxID=2606717 RepID=A0ACD4NK53_9HYPH|nr:hypothetical protein [Antarcticirhabdus aurantiaca]WAJ27158.1 hypothetical protein OXU80_20210 [Jeongeuplla avenae]
MTSDELGLPQSPAQAAEGEGDIVERLRADVATQREFSAGAIARIEAKHPGLLRPEAVALMRADIKEEAANEIERLRTALSAEGSANAAAARLAAEEMRDRAAKVAEAAGDTWSGTRDHAQAAQEAAVDEKCIAIAEAIRSIPLPSSFPEDQEKAAATPTIADPVKEGGRDGLR